MKLLLWIYEDREPSEWKVQQELLEIDSDSSGSLDRVEWLKYLSCADPKTG